MGSSPFHHSKSGEGEGTHAPSTPKTPLCDICNTTLAADWAKRGYTTHLGCDPTTGSHPNTKAS